MMDDDDAVSSLAAAPKKASLTTSLPSNPTPATSPLALKPVDFEQSSSLRPLILLLFSSSCLLYLHPRLCVEKKKKLNLLLLTCPFNS